MSSLEIIGYVALLVFGAYGGMLIGTRMRDAEVKALKDLTRVQRDQIEHNEKLIDAIECVAHEAIEALKARGVEISSDSFPNLFSFEIMRMQRALANGLRDMLQSWQEDHITDGHN